MSVGITLEEHLAWNDEASTAGRTHLDALFQCHRKAMGIFRNLLAAPVREWDEIYEVEISWIPDDFKKQTRRKVAAHALFHSHRHWAQLDVKFQQVVHSI